MDLVSIIAVKIQVSVTMSHMTISPTIITHTQYLAHDNPGHQHSPTQTTQRMNMPHFFLQNYECRNEYPTNQPTTCVRCIVCVDECQWTGLSCVIYSMWVIVVLHCPFMLEIQIDYFRLGFVDFIRRNNLYFKNLFIVPTALQKSEKRLEQ